jgi:hypothetical protein
MVPALLPALPLEMMHRNCSCHNLSPGQLCLDYN